MGMGHPDPRPQSRSARGVPSCVAEMAGATGAVNERRSETLRARLRGATPVYALCLISDNQRRHRLVFCQQYDDEDSYQPLHAAPLPGGQRPTSRHR